MTTRFPFTSFPQGWFVVAFSSEIGVGEVKTVHYFGTDIVLFRGADGALSALDKTCPHLGAHLGGGRVEGNCLRCPFHDWAFDRGGQCVEVPYAPKIPPRARVRAWPLLEQNGVVFVHHSLDGAPPTWTPAALPEEGWTENRTIRWELKSHPQEVAENTVDCSHLRPVHHVIKTELLELEQQAHVMRVLLHLHATGHAIGMPDEVNDVHLDVKLQGLGHIVSDTQVLTSGMKTRQRIHPTPIDGERIAIFAIGNTQRMPDPAYTAEIDQIFWEAFCVDFPRDFPIWENKAYLDRPLLASGDGPIGSYRKWCRQFYGASGARPALEDAADASGAQGRSQVAASRLLRLVQAATGAVERLRGAIGASSVQAPPSDASETAPASRTPSVAPSEKPGARPRFDSVDAYFETLQQRFDPEAAGDLRAVFQWILRDEPNRQHFATVEGGKIDTAIGVHAAPTLTIEMTAADYLKMINGELNGALAFSTGRGRLSGPVKLAMRMQRIFPLSS